MVAQRLYSDRVGVRLGGRLQESLIPANPSGTLQVGWQEQPRSDSNPRRSHWCSADGGSNGHGRRRNKEGDCGARMEAPSRKQKDGHRSYL